MCTSKKLNKIYKKSNKFAWQREPQEKEAKKHFSDSRLSSSVEVSIGFLYMWKLSKSELKNSVTMCHWMQFIALSCVLLRTCFVIVFTHCKYLEECMNGIHNVLYLTVSSSIHVHYKWIINFLFQYWRKIAQHQKQ